MLENLPVVTVEAIVRFRAAAIKVEQQRDAVLAALEKAIEIINCVCAGAKVEEVEEFETLIKSIHAKD